MDELIELERAGWAALCDGTAADFYQRTMSDDALMVLADGTVMGRTDAVAALGGAPPWSSYEMDEIRIVRISSDVAALVYVGTGHRAGGPDHLAKRKRHPVSEELHDDEGDQSGNETGDERRETDPVAHSVDENGRGDGEHDDDPELEFDGPEEVERPHGIVTGGRSCRARTRCRGPCG